MRQCIFKWLSVILKKPKSIHKPVVVEKQYLKLNLDYFLIIPTFKRYLKLDNDYYDMFKLTYSVKSFG